MNKVTKRGALFLALGFCVASLGLTDEEQQAKESKDSIKIAKRFLKECKKEEVTVPLGGLGWEEVRTYWAKVPALKKLREEFEEAEEALKETMMDDEVYAALKKRMEGPDRAEAVKEYNSTKGEIFRRMDRSSSAYRRARKIREEALFESNIETLEYIINDYESKGWVIPTEWMKSCDCGHSH